MTWGSVSAFLAMGGYGGYIWGSYGVTVLCIALELALLAARRRKLLRG
jgi:heme exporter protein D